ncbi:MAG: hypothetical protein ACYC6W_10945 [Nitrosotalea sp.]
MIKPIWTRHWLDDMTSCQWSKNTADYIQDLWSENISELSKGQLNLIRRSVLKDLHDKEDFNLIDLIYYDPDSEINVKNLENNLYKILFDEFKNVPSDFSYELSITEIIDSIVSGLDEKIRYLMDLYKQYEEKIIIEDAGFRD